LQPLLNRSRFALRLAHKMVHFQNLCTIKAVIFGHVINPTEIALERLGTQYGGWWVPLDLNSTSSNKVLVSAGLGFDTTFDQEMLDRGFFIIGLDPSQESCQYALQELKRDSRVRVINRGLSTFVGQQVFYEPTLSNHFSWSTIRLNDRENEPGKYFEVINLDWLYSEYPEMINAEFRYLKMDIEGSELEILENPTEALLSFHFLGIEMDFLSLLPFTSFRERIQRILRARKILKYLKGLNFQLIKTENFNFFWAKQ
jgi:hypothetical protein